MTFLGGAGDDSNDGDIDTRTGFCLGDDFHDDERDGELREAGAAFVGGGLSEPPHVDSRILNEVIFMGIEEFCIMLLRPWYDQVAPNRIKGQDRCSPCAAPAA